MDRLEVMVRLACSGDTEARADERGKWARDLADDADALIAEDARRGAVHRDRHGALVGEVTRGRTVTTGDSIRHEPIPG